MISFGGRGKPATDTDLIFLINKDVGIMNPRGVGRKKLIFFAIVVVVFLTMVYKLQICVNDKPTNVYISNPAYVAVNEDSRAKMFTYNRDMPIIFIGGVPRSGTTLMRAMLDAHPDIRCGQETRVIPRILQMRQHWLKSTKESVRLAEAGIDADVLDAAISSFILEIIARHGEPADRLCNKDPLTLKSGDYLAQLFPNSKFLFMVRDGRATVHSIISRKVSITGFDLDNYEQCLKKWNDAISTMYLKCAKIGYKRCKIVYYEQLVLHPKKWMTGILEFLDIPWNDSVLHHEQLINKPGGVILSKVERSSDQVIKPVNMGALTKWAAHFPNDVLERAAEWAPMLAKLGYDPTKNPPNYGSPDPFVYNNTQQVLKNAEKWDQRADSLLQSFYPDGGNQNQFTLLPNASHEIALADSSNNNGDG